MENLNESNLSRLYKHMQEHDCGTVTAYRSARECGKGEPYTHNENRQRNRKLLAMLQYKRYGVTSVKGGYIENFKTPNAKQVAEHVFFVVDSKDTGELKQELMRLGELFDQDSIMFIPKGGDTSYLIGTNHCPDGYPGYGVVKTYSHRSLGNSGEFFTMVGNRPFVFSEEIIREHVLPEGFFGRWGCHAVANTPWEKIELAD